MHTRSGKYDGGNSNASDYEESNDGAEEQRARGAPAAAPVAPAAAAAPRGGACAGEAVHVNTETFLAGIMESFVRMQTETNRSLVETLRALPFNSGHWSPSAATPPSYARPPSDLSSAGTGSNFSKCTARFNGRSRDAEVLEAFLDSVQVFKECTGVGDEHALRGLPMLLEGDAAVWWRGARAQALTWPDAVSRLRTMYGMQQPAHKVLRDIFAAEQNDSERAEVFVCRLRSLIVKLPYAVPTDMQIDMMYGLLHRRVRKRLPRDSINDVDSFVEKARAIEDAISETKVGNNSSSSAKSPSAAVPTPRAAREIGPVERSVTTCPRGTTGAKPTSKRDRRVQCTYCKIFGHVESECRNVHNKQAVGTVADVDTTSTGTNPIRCYICGQPGVVRSKCDTCSTKTVPAKSYDFNIVTSNAAAYVRSVTETSHPTVSVTIADKIGVVILDTGATCSVAGSMLHSILRSAGVQFRETDRTIGLADGSRQRKAVLTATIPVTLEGRQIATEFVVFPGENTRTLLGRDFIRDASVTLNIAQESWYFSDSPHQIFPFVKSMIVEDTELMRADVANVIADTLSRPACPAGTDCDLCLTVVDLPSRSPKDVRENQLKDPEVLKIVEAIESDDPFRGRAWADKGYVLTDGVLYRYGPENEENDDASLVVPEHKRKDVLAEYHKAPTVGHFGVERTLQRLVGEYYWPGMKAYVAQYVKNCTACQRYKANDTSRGQTPKFIPRRDGPYRIREVIGSVTYALERNSDGVVLGKYHVSQLTPFVGPIQAPVQEKGKRGRRRRKANPVSGT